MSAALSVDLLSNLLQNWKFVIEVHSYLNISVGFDWAGQMASGKNQVSSFGDVARGTYV